MMQRISSFVELFESVTISNQNHANGANYIYTSLQCNTESSMNVFFRVV